MTGLRSATSASARSPDSARAAQNTSIESVNVYHILWWRMLLSERYNTRPIVKMTKLFFTLPSWQLEPVAGITSIAMQDLREIQSISTTVRSYRRVGSRHLSLESVGHTPLPAP